ncbi:predicted protein [Enterococcus faecium 1,141,733]|nr:predicted protein [Enterococcus faecium 1,141,733]
MKNKKNDRGGWPRSRSYFYLRSKNEKVYRVVGWYVYRIEDKCEEIVHYFFTFIRL